MKVITLEPGTHIYRHADLYPVHHIESRGPGDVIVEGERGGFWSAPYLEFDPITITVLGEAATLELHGPPPKVEV